MKFTAEKFLVFLGYLVIVLWTIQILYFERSFFLEPYDASYWQDRFEHSQWRLPLSRRIIGDDGLYAYVGYQLVHGANPAEVNAETPPLGKYLIGLSLVLFGNPAYYAFFLGIGCLFLFYLVAKRLLADTMVPPLLTALLFLEPLFFTQLWKAWLDISQLFFFLANLFFLILLEQSKKKEDWLLAGLAGFTLGLFAVTKPALLLPIALFGETTYFIFRGRKKEYPLFLLSVFAAVLLVYSRYFLLGYSLLDFLKLLKHIFWFFRQSQLEVHPGAVWQTLFLGKYPHIATGLPTPVAEWWLLWPVLTAIGLVTSLILLLKRNISLIWRGIAFFLLATLFVYSLVPMYSRYLLILLPLLFLLSAKALEKLKKENFKTVILVFALLGSFSRASLSLAPSPEGTLNNFYYNLSHQYFQDIYQENLAKEGRPNLTRKEFWRVCQKALDQATVKAIEIEEKERNLSKWRNKGEVKLRLTYKTQDLGPFSEEKVIKLVKENGQWKIKWNWDIVLSGFLPDYHIETKIIPGKRGSIVGPKRSILAQDANGYLIAVEPEKIAPQKEEEMLELISRLGHRDSVELYNGYQESVLPGSVVPLVTLSVPLTDKTRKALLSYPGVTLVEYPIRAYNGLDPTEIENTFYNECCTRIYSRYNYRGIKGLEKEYDEILFGYDGGKILVKNEKGEVVRTLLEKRAKNGQNVILSF